MKSGKKWGGLCLTGFVIFALNVFPAQSKEVSPAAEAVAEATQLNIDDLLGRSPIEISPEKIKKTASQLLASKKYDPKLGAEVIEAKSAEEGFTVAVAEMGTGVKAIKVGSGIAFVATGIGNYQLYPNPNASRMSQRQAYVMGLMNAKKELLSYLKGLSIQAKESLREEAVDFNDETDTLVNRSSSYNQEINRFMDGMIRGFTTYRVIDDHDTKAVYVSIVTSPKIRQALWARSNGVLEAASVAAGLKRVFRDIEGGVIPPVGGRIVSVPETNEVAVISFGSAIILDYEGAQKGKELRIANTRAKADADKALVGILQGEKFIWESGMARTQDEFSENFEIILKEDPYGNTLAERKKLDEIKNSFLSAVSNTETHRSALKGTIPPGVNSKTWKSADQGWVFVADVYLPSATAAAKEAAREIGLDVPEDTRAPLAKPFDPGKGPSGQIQDDETL